MNKFKVGDRVITYSSPHLCSLGRVFDVRGGEVFITPDILNKAVFSVHYKTCRRLVKKKRECQHPHITREKLAEAWDKCGYVTKSFDSNAFKVICEELGL